MYLHLGQTIIVRAKDVLGIFDIETSTISKNTRDFLARAEKKGDVINVTNELPKSFIVTACKNDIKIYISQISATTLKKRSSYLEDIRNINKE